MKREVTSIREVTSFVLAADLHPGWIDAPYAETLYGPRTSTFCNQLRHNTMQNNLVRGPLKKVGTANIDFS